MKYDFEVHLTGDALVDTAQQMWAACYALDEARGDSKASDWLAAKVRDLMASGETWDLGQIEAIRDALEGQLDVRSTQYTEEQA